MRQRTRWRAANAEASTVSRSIAFHPGRLDDLGPALDLAIDERISLFGSDTGELATFTSPGRAQLRILDRLVHFGVESLHDVLRCVGGHKHDVPGDDFETGPASFDHGGDFGCERRACFTGHGKRFERA